MALLIAIPIVAGVVVGCALRWLAPHAIPPIRIRGVPVVILAAGLEALRLALPGDWVSADVVARGFGAVDLVLVAVFVHLNRPSRTGWMVSLPVALAGVGVAANAAAVVLAGGMPYSRSAALAVGYTPEELSADLPGYVEADSVPTAVAALGDLIPFHALMKVLSIGDLLLFAGVAATIAMVTAGLLVAPAQRSVVSAT